MDVTYKKPEEQKYTTPLVIRVTTDKVGLELTPKGFNYIAYNPATARYENSRCYISIDLLRKVVELYDEAEQKGHTE